ncbi:MAG: UDP-glucose/GDP-mannose dehydrogenase family protein [Azoarcus sp.]|jgi:UDPglucose 6-dehydrogenase|nr:UDP-glucose/GDP-mannose dehydrogenase family protein [Azoarcus sp.]
MRVTVIGTGYVGLVSGACLADVGNEVLCLDIDPGKIRLLEEGGLPIHEPGLLEIVSRNVQAGRLFFTTDIERAARHGMVQFIAVDTPPGDDGSPDLQYVLAAARNIGRYMDGYRVVANKSTGPIGTGDKIQATIAEELAVRGEEIPFAVVSNPEFLKTGAAVEDFMRPDRIIIGTEDEQAAELLRGLYAPFQLNHDKLLVMDIRSAELTRYAANAMLATRISFMDELANLAEILGADIELVRQGIGSDPRIGRHFLYAGCGYGGSCFPKDVRTLIRTGHENGHDMQVLRAVEEANERQKHRLVDKIIAHFGDRLDGLRFALWGLAFKPDTDDMCEAPSCVVIDELTRRGANITAYDPMAINEARRVFADTDKYAGLSYVTRPMDAVLGADALIIVTEWKELRNPDFDVIRTALKQPVIFDGRNLYDPAEMRRYGVAYHGIGRQLP